MGFRTSREEIDPLVLVVRGILTEVVSVRSDRGLLVVGRIRWPR